MEEGGGTLRWTKIPSGGKVGLNTRSRFLLQTPGQAPLVRDSLARRRVHLFDGIVSLMHNPQLARKQTLRAGKRQAPFLFPMTLPRGESTCGLLWNLLRVTDLACTDSIPAASATSRLRYDSNSARLEQFLQPLLVRVWSRAFCFRRLGTSNRTSQRRGDCST